MSCIEHDSGFQSSSLSDSRDTPYICQLAMSQSVLMNYTTYSMVVISALKSQIETRILKYNARVKTRSIFQCKLLTGKSQSYSLNKVWHNKYSK